MTICNSTTAKGSLFLFIFSVNIFLVRKVKQGLILGGLFLNLERGFGERECVCVGSENLEEGSQAILYQEGGRSLGGGGWQC